MLTDPADAAADDLGSVLPEHAVVDALRAIVVRLERIDDTLTYIAGRPFDA